ncbi:hypothetical protein EJ05DRAFT_525849 [Pseudovirgaria hyperparasitica]|uniref:Uncharacterized protein n=1 Tax=Pseudovirgaria hyperparasitica TaxID=470096 RepID=A0A6A6VSP2_9PEZI|nr:uncharacterized protein EJ05DRAFT_525849 [Pseudovirgaria hyperparasitica]KAF2752610.1 hypothetical protein EJ05DRAFT_525849 [Pseudovirgaria hyperparasitica]
MSLVVSLGLIASSIGIPAGGIGLVSGILGIVNFVLSHEPTRQALGPAIRIKVGSEPPDGEAFAGDIEHVWTYNTRNQVLGGAKGRGTIGSGDVWDVTVPSPGGGETCNYVNIAAKNNAICIAWVGVKQSDGSDLDGSWNGDIGAACGQNWYHQQEPAGRCPDNVTSTNSSCVDGLWVPRCTWIDGDGTNGIISKSLKFNVFSYSNKSVPSTLQQGMACSSTIFSGESQIFDRPAGPTVKYTYLSSKRAIEVSQTPRGLPVRKRWMEERLVVSDMKAHNATSLCNSPTSWGPDFCDSETCCDMAHHKAHPRCDKNPVSGCMVVHDDGESIALRKRTMVAKRDVLLPYRTYKHIKRWSLSNKKARL